MLNYFGWRRMYCSLHSFIQFWNDIIFIIVVVAKLQKTDTFIHFVEVDRWVWVVVISVNWSHSLREDWGCLMLLCENSSIIFSFHFFVQSLFSSCYLCTPVFRMVFISCLKCHFVVLLAEIYGFDLGLIRRFLVVLWHLLFQSKSLFVNFLLPVLWVVRILIIFSSSVNVIFKETINLGIGLA